MDKLPTHVSALVEQNHFLHLGTSKNDVPHVSLMNYTFVPRESAAPYETEPVIIVATQRDTQKFENLKSNANVSVLIHDWVAGKTSGANGSLGGLANFLAQLNQAEYSSLSATFKGTATILSGDAEVYFRNLLTASRTNEARCFIEGAAVILIKLTGATVTDNRNNVNSYDL